MKITRLCLYLKSFANHHSRKHVSPRFEVHSAKPCHGSMRAGRGAFRAPPSVCGAVGGREGEAWGGGRVRTPAQPRASALRLRLQPAPRQRTAPKSPPPLQAATSGTLGRSAGRGQASVSVSAGQAGGRASAAHAQPPAPCFPLPAWYLGAGGAVRGHRAPPRHHAFTNVVASEIVAYATIYKCYCI